MIYDGKNLKLVLLDANFYWSEQLFSSYQDFADILLLKPRDFRAFRQDYGNYLTDLQPKQIAKKIWEQRICCPPGWLFNYWSITKHFLAFIIRKFQQNNPLIFVYCYPYYASLTQKLDSYSIYYSFDDYTDYWLGKEAKTQRQETQAIDQADLILCTAHHRAKIFQSQHQSKRDRIIHLPHGCSPQFMTEQPISFRKSLPPELKTYRRPIAGYIGALSYRFDFNYLAKVAAKLPEVTFLLGGNTPKIEDGSSQWWQGVIQIRKLANVHFIGHVPHEKLGDYLQSFDLLLMCYSQCNFNDNICPTKLWDYMGTSLPIVANDIVPEVNLWRDYLLVANNIDQYVEYIQFALNNPDWQAQTRLDIAQQHTWNKQADKLHQILEKRLLMPQV